MTQLAYVQFCSLVGTLSENLTARETIAAIRESHSNQLEAITPHIVENAIVNIRRNVLRRKAKLFVEGYGDLFEPYNVPARLPRPGVGNARPTKVPPDKLTKDELWQLILEYRLRPPKKERYLSELEKIHSDIDSYCSGEETVEAGLKRRKGE
ncbi:hypothetical protein [Mesorhizobium sp. B2-4-6]|uniref:hypothetical protein n=1 Tax=Mesorhizobium sp. B2-4-6 TaxID=2589943 RepID=UPI001127CD46|nr:hypothetical protein [Mesorhizobium sp. B2-4-6]TPL51789.1 hypothetical protein FJ957_09490 [Mesorhizobium sp. B2-4-6]